VYKIFKLDESGLSGEWKGTMGLTTMTRAGSALAVVLGLMTATPAMAHHSFAKWDMSDEALVKFTGVIETMEFRNPHMAMTLRVPDDNGGSKLVSFPEGGPRNMLIRMGIRDEDMAVGKTITVYGSPLRSDHSEFFSKRFEFPDGRVIDVMGGPQK
jgi:hypothetical protein